MRKLTSKINLKTPYPQKGTIYPVKRNRIALPEPLLQIVHSLLHSELSDFLKTMCVMFWCPGIFLNIIMQHQPKGFAKPVAYFFGALTIYLSIVICFFKRHNLYCGVLADMNEIELAILLASISLIAWVINDPTKLSYWTVCKVFLYVYGTLFLIDIPFLLIEASVPVSVKRFSLLTQSLLTDVPSIIIICNAMYRLYKRKKMSMVRYVSTLICCVTFYLLFMTYYITHNDEKISEVLPTFFCPKGQIMVCEKPGINRLAVIDASNKVLEIEKDKLVCGCVLLQAP